MTAVYLPGDIEADMAAIGVGWKPVPEAGHPMGLQNPAGLARTGAEVMASEAIPRS